MFTFYILCFILGRFTTPIHSKIWIPKYENENTFNDPFDYVDTTHLPNFEEFGYNYDWISIAGTSLDNQKKSYVAFTGTRKNNATGYDTVFTKQSGIILLCSSKLNELNSVLGFDFKCVKLEENDLKKNDAKYFGAVVKSVKSKNDTVAFIYCDPLWVDTNSVLNQPSGKCKLSLVKDFENMKHYEFKVCDKFKKCLGGFSVDLVSIDQDIDIIFGLPFENSTLLLRRAESFQIDQGIENKGNFFNFGYSVAFSGDGSQYISSPISDGHSPFVKMLNGEKFYPTNIKTQSYGGFGTSIDTLSVRNGLYGVVIGAPYQSKQSFPNVGAVYLACKGYATDIVYGENPYDYFGYAVARLGDIDLDGSEEFVVSAPNLNFNKPGKIYIYKTTKYCTISKVPIQIHQSDIKGFGIAISRGFDINFNGKPDFFVTALNYQTPMLFKMPSQEKVTCSWSEQNKGTIFTKGETFDIEIIFDSPNIKNYKEYFYQVSIDFLNKDESRFKLNNTKLINNHYTLTLETLIDVQDMDLKVIPLKIAIKGVRLCKESNNKKCFLSRTANVDWLKCEKIIKITQNVCPKPNCVSDLNMKIIQDLKGPVIYYGDQKDYQRSISIIINNNGPDSIPRIYMSIDSKPDLLITNVKCFGHCKKELTATGQNAKILIKDVVEKRENEKDDFNITVDFLYNKLENATSTTSINFNIWGVNDDNILQNNNYSMTYSILFKPHLILSSKKTKEVIIDDRIKPPYLDNLKRVPVHELGTELQYSYIIENKGPTLKNVELKFYFPFKTKDGKLILYIMDIIRLSINEAWQNVLPSISNKNGFIQNCKLSKDMINPLNIIGVEPHKNHENSGKLYRSKRKINDDTNSESNLTDIELSLHSVKYNAFTSEDMSTVIKCNESSKGLGEPICGEISCNIDVMPMNSEFYFNFRSWLFTKTFFDAHIADLTITTALQSNFGILPKGITISDNISFIGPLTSSKKVLFNKMKIREIKPLPLWPIIVAVIIGIFLLVIIIVIAYYCGFFNRKRLRKERQKIRDNAQKNQESLDTVPLATKI